MLLRIHQHTHTCVIIVRNRPAEVTPKLIRRRTTKKPQTTRSEDWGKQFVHVSKSGKYAEDVGHLLDKEYVSVEDLGDREVSDDEDYLKLPPAYGTIESKYTLPTNDQYNPYNEENTKEREIRGDYIVTSEEFHDKLKQKSRISTPKEQPRYAKSKSINRKGESERKAKPLTPAQFVREKRQTYLRKFNSPHMQKELDFLLEKNKKLEIERKRKLKQKEDNMKLPKATEEIKVEKKIQALFNSSIAQSSASSCCSWV